MAKKIISKRSSLDMLWESFELVNMTNTYKKETDGDLEKTKGDLGKKKQKQREI